MQTALHDELREFQADHEWIEQNRALLIGQYPDQWIAVKIRHVIASDPNLDQLLARLPDPTKT